MDLLKVIKYEGDDETLVWKHPEEDFNTQTQLIVHESQEAILFRDGKALDLFGPGKYTLETQNIPLLRKLINIPTKGDTPFHCEIYFINKATSLDMMWGTKTRFQVLDPQFNIPLNVGASGSMEFLIEDARKFLIKVVGTQNIVTTDKLLKYFKEKTATKVKTSLATIMSEVSYLIINQRLEDISEAIKEKLKEDYEEYGVKLINFYVSTIFIPDEDTSKVKEVLNKQMEYGALNYNWADEQIADISKKYASNPGTQDNVGGMVAQIPIAMAFGEMLKGNISPSTTTPFGDRGIAFNNNTPERENSNKKFCRKCGKELENDANFCTACGEKIESKLECSECGNEVSDEDIFCSKCGNKLN